MANIHYKDTDDKSTSNMIDQQYGANYWQLSEEEVLAYAIGFLRQIPESSKKMLDVGCGEGRLIETFLPECSKVVAVEPDPKRYQKALEKTQKGVTVINGTIDDIAKEEKFDIILISHVFQHIHDEEVNHILEQAKNRLKDDGLLVITTTFHHGKEDVYTLAGLEDGKFVEKTINKALFDAVVSSSDIDKGLPTRLFTCGAMSEALSKLFDEVHFKPFHYLEGKVMENPDGSLQTNDECRKDMNNARDAIYMARAKRGR